MRQQIFQIFLHLLHLSFSFPYPGALPSVYYYKVLDPGLSTSLILPGAEQGRGGEAGIKFQASPLASIRNDSPSRLQGCSSNHRTSSFGPRRLLSGSLLLDELRHLLCGDKRVPHMGRLRGGAEERRPVLGSWRAPPRPGHLLR